MERDSTHVEQHGDGDVTIEGGEPSNPQPEGESPDEAGTAGGEPQGAGPEGGEDEE